MPALPVWIAKPPSFGWNAPDGVVTTPSTVTVVPSGRSRACRIDVVAAQATAASASSPANVAETTAIR